MKRIDDVFPGNVYTRLTVISKIMVKNVTHWLCKCSCGKETTVNHGQLRLSITKSCGCLKMDKLIDRSKKHGRANKNDPTYNSWCMLRDRCNNINNEKYSMYGARGIKVCDRWNSFENFLEDMGEKPKGKTIDRIDVNGDYCPDNCRWATPLEQARNKTTTIRVEYNGKIACLKEVCEMAGKNYATMKNVVANNKIIGNYIPGAKIVSR